MYSNWHQLALKTYSTTRLCKGSEQLKNSEDPRMKRMKSDVPHGQQQSQVRRKKVCFFGYLTSL